MLQNSIGTTWSQASHYVDANIDFKPCVSTQLQDLDFKCRGLQVISGSIINICNPGHQDCFMILHHVYLSNFTSNSPNLKVIFSGHWMKPDPKPPYLIVTTTVWLPVGHAHLKSLPRRSNTNARDRSWWHFFREWRIRVKSLKWWNKWWNNYEPYKLNSCEFHLWNAKCCGEAPILILICPCTSCGSSCEESNFTVATDMFQCEADTPKSTPLGTCHMIATAGFP